MVICERGLQSFGNVAVGATADCCSNFHSILVPQCGGHVYIYPCSVVTETQIRRKSADIFNTSHFYVYFDNTRN